MGFKTNFDQISPALPFSFCQLLSPTPQCHSSYLDFNTVGVSSLEDLASGVFLLLPLLQQSFSSHLPHVLQVSPYGAGFLLLLHAFFEYIWTLSFKPDQAVG